MRSRHSCYEGCTNLWYKRFRVQKKLVTSAIFKKYLQCVLAAKILTVYFVVCTLAAKKKSGQVSTCRIGPFPCKFTDFSDECTLHCVFSSRATTKGKHQGVISFNASGVEKGIYPND
jgi:hypothetical protein